MFTIIFILCYNYFSIIGERSEQMYNKKYNFIIYLYVIFVCSIVATPVLADECNGILTVEAMDFLDGMIGYIRIFVPILLIILGIVDFASAIIAQDQEALKKCGTKFVKRIIAAVAVFFVPSVVKLLLNLPGIKDNINLVDDPTCGL